MLLYLDTSSNTRLIYNVSSDWIPPFNLTTVQLGSCKFPNGFPQWLRTQKNLKKLVLSNSNIYGPLPTRFKHMPIVPHLDISDNKLCGPLTNLPLRDRFHGFQDEYRGSLLLQNNLFNGSIPKSLCRRTALEVLNLSRNKLVGKIPTCLQNLQKLRVMILSYNGLSGVIPSYIGRNSLLSWLHLNNDNFIGEIHKDLASLRRLWVLDFSNNELSGKIPEWISELTELMILRLYKSNFTGRIPSSLCKNAWLQIFDVAHNNLKGPIPRCVGELSGRIDPNSCRHYVYSKEEMIQVLKGVELQFSRILSLVVNMDLSSNELVGPIPEELTRLTGLIGLNVSHNKLTGNIPDNIGNKAALMSLDFSENKLTGMIPQSLVYLNFLDDLNLSHNNLSGRIPTGTQLDTLADPSRYAANEDLCGPPVMKICLNPVPANTTATENKDKKVWFYLDVISGFATGFSAVIGALLFSKKWRK